MTKTKTLITAIALAFAGVANAQTGEYYSRVLPSCPIDSDIGPCYEKIFVTGECPTDDAVGPCIVREVISQDSTQLEVE